MKKSQEKGIPKTVFMHANFIIHCDNCECVSMIRNKMFLVVHCITNAPFFDLITHDD